MINLKKNKSRSVWEISFQYHMEFFSMIIYLFGFKNHERYSNLKENKNRL